MTALTDREIIELYLTRDESAIAATAQHYGSYCTSIAMNILRNREDAEECVNEAFLKVWNSIPPQQPRVFSSFLGRITRNLSLDYYKAQSAQKRGGGQTEQLLSELEKVIPSSADVEAQVDGAELSRAIDGFLCSIKREEAAYFIRRYWYGDTVPEIAQRYIVGQF